MRYSRLFLNCLLAVCLLHATNAAEAVVDGNSSAIVAPELFDATPQVVVAANSSATAEEVQLLTEEELQSGHENTSARKARQFGPGPGFGGYRPYPQPPPPFGYPGYGGGFGGGFGRTRVITRTRTRYVNRGFGGGFYG